MAISRSRNKLVRLALITLHYKSFSSTTLRDLGNHREEDEDDEKVGFVRIPETAKTRAEIEEERRVNWFYLQRSPLWKGRAGSKEALLVVRELKRAKKDPWKLHVILSTKVDRLLKLDLIAALNELQRLEEVDLALMVFVVVRREPWYKPEAYLFRDMLNCLGRNKRAAQSRILLNDCKREGIKPSSSLCTELMVAFLKHGMVCEAIEVFEEVKAVDACDKLIFRILMRELLRLGRDDLWSKYRNEYEEAYGAEYEEYQFDGGALK
ncbi:hypothetical protein GOP47_0011370 [Adiantum capillus-veneris]|uniref:Pentatricopeptide repeat-containing protein n=1 Tax=Adiantum capillus-veneris TaxID=13818 RepID=A0A9D4ZGN6_ADICA|nr:hypothetical protein GOP47_0011370 [Adiantum capillus-veneris]